MSSTPTPSPGWKSLVAGGVACGVLDILAAFTNAWFANGTPPGRVLQAVASGALGADAFKGGAGVSAFGLFLHFCIAFAWAGLFVLLARRFRRLVDHAVVSGLVYGALVYVAMTYAVLPLAAQVRTLYIPATRPFVPRWGWPQFGIHLLFVGLAITLAVRRWSKVAGNR